MPDWSLNRAIFDQLDCPGCGLAQSWKVLVGYETDDDGDVYLTKSLFDQIQRGELLRRHDGTALLLPKAGGAA